MGWESLIIQVVYIIIGTVVPLAGLWVRKRLATMNKVDELLMKEGWAQAAANFAEQTYGALEGPQQLEQALKWASARFKENGLKFSEEELRGLVEDAVYKLKEGWVSYYEEDIDIL